jgi:hypothetical protein
VIDKYTTWWKVKEMYLQHSVEYLPLPDQARSAILLQRFKMEETVKVCEEFAGLVGKEDSIPVHLEDGTIPRIRWGWNGKDYTNISRDAIGREERDDELLVLPFIDWDVNAMLRKHCPEAHGTLKRIHWEQPRIESVQSIKYRLEGLCALHSYGGIYVDNKSDNRGRTNGIHIFQGGNIEQEAWFDKSIGWNQMLNATMGSNTSNMELRGSKSSFDQQKSNRNNMKPPPQRQKEPPVAYITVASDFNTRGNMTSIIDMNSIISIAAPPKHPIVHCLLQGVVNKSNKILEKFGEGNIDTNLKKGEYAIDFRINVKNQILLNNTKLHMIGSSCSTLTLAMTERDSRTLTEVQGPNMSSVHIQIFELLQNDDEKVTSTNITSSSSSSSSSTRTNAEVDRIIFKESENSSYAAIDKPTLYNKLLHEQCIPNIEAKFGCHYCLCSPLQGSILKCPEQCPSCWKDIMHSPPSRTRNQKVIILAETQEGFIRDETRKHQAYEIPRIIHQTWFEDLNTEDYPDLIRLQNSWKQTEAYGFEYRFYTDASAFEYIQENFPPLVLQAYETLQPGAFKVILLAILLLTT